jgi:hypothetical protein
LHKELNYWECASGINDHRQEEEWSEYLAVSQRKGGIKKYYENEREHNKGYNGQDPENKPN